MNSSVRAIYLVGLLYRNESNDFGDELVKVGAKLFYRRGRTHLDGGGELTIGRNLQCADTVQSFVNPCFLAAGSPFC